MSDEPLWSTAQIASIPAIPSPLPVLPTYAEYMTAVGAGGAEVYAETGLIIDSIYLARDQYWYLVGLTKEGPHQWPAGLPDELGVVVVDRLPLGTSYVGVLRPSSLT